MPKRWKIVPEHFGNVAEMAGKVVETSVRVAGVSVNIVGEIDKKEKMGFGTLKPINFLKNKKYLL